MYVMYTHIFEWGFHENAIGETSDACLCIISYLFLSEFLNHSNSKLVISTLIKRLFNHRVVLRHAQYGPFSVCIHLLVLVKWSKTTLTLLQMTLTQLSTFLPRTRRSLTRRHSKSHRWKTQRTTRSCRTRKSRTLCLQGNLMQKPHHFTTISTRQC